MGQQWPPLLWLSRIERVAWAAERRLTKNENTESGTNKSHRCDKMNFKKIYKLKYSLRRRIKTRCSNKLLLLFIAYSSIQFACRLSSLPIKPADASLIIGDSAIEIQEVQDDSQFKHQMPPLPEGALHNGQPQNHSPTNFQANLENRQPTPNDQLLLQIEQSNNNVGQQHSISNDELASVKQQQYPMNSVQQRNHVNRLPSSPLPPIDKSQDDITDGDKRSRGNHDYDIRELYPSRADERRALSEILKAPNDKENDDTTDGKQIAGKVVDFELTPAGGHNKAKIKKKKKKKAHEEAEAFKKWGKKHKAEKKFMEKKEKEHMKKKKEEGKKKKKKWGEIVQGHKKKGNFKKKKWGEKVKKGKGIKKGKKGKKFLKDKGHKNTGFKTVYHKEEWGKSAKWHDIKREKKWDEKSKKWKKKWKKEKGKKYKGDHMKKFEQKKKEGKKYKKAKKEQHKKYKKEKFEAGKKKKMEEHKKKKEEGKKKMMKEEKKKKKKMR